jgi:CRP-like cAMP-binding protein
LFVVSCFLFLVSCFLFLVSCFLFLVSCFLFVCLFVVLFSGVCFLSWCSTLTDDEREDIARMMKRQKYAINDKIIEQGDTSDTFYVIEIGEVQFTVTDPKTKTVKDVGTFFQNQFFGEASLLNNAPRRATATAIAETVCYTLSGKAIRSTFMDFSMRDANLMQLLVSIVKAYIACMLATETQASAAAATVGEVSDESLLTEREMLNAGLPQLDQALLAAIRSTHYMTVHDLEKNVDIIRIRSCKQFDKKTAVARGTATRKKKEEKKRKQQQQREEEECKRRQGIVKHKWVKIKTFTGSTSKFGGKWNSKKTHSGGGGWGTLLKHKS